MHRRRRGFTLVEILVALALTIFILSILSQAFVTGADTFRHLKSVGDLNASLRTTTTMLRSDLAADHFEGKRRLSDTKFWKTPNNGPPKLGYFYLEQGTGAGPGDADEGNDADTLPSRRRVGHKLAFTVKARGFAPKDYFTARVPAGLLTAIGNPDGRFQQPNTLSSQWIEVCYFLEAIPQATAEGSTPLYALYRQQRLLVADNDALNWVNLNQIAATPTTLASYAGKVSCQVNPNQTASSFLYFNSPADVTIPERRAAAVFPPLSKRTGTFVAASFAAFKDGAGNLTGQDLLLTDVLSFDIKVLRSNSTADFTDLPSPLYFDTWSRRQDDVYDYSAATIPASSYTIWALQITIRVWDQKSKLARQITMIQDM
jgi:prepilin-type N-terminal cleavage/methylation domain-containing protein